MENSTLAGQFEFKIKIAEMGIQMIDALNVLHKIGFTHWDIKLDNICYANGTYYLIDFAFS
jgi:tRNA A-37 threonylcarbamoyl transferase component Bud32